MESLGRWWSFLKRGEVGLGTFNGKMGGCLIDGLLKAVEMVLQCGGLLFNNFVQVPW